jgi:hypothetical protein
MKRVIAALIVGLAVGYKMGYGDGTDGRSSIVARTVDRFGASKIKTAEREREKKMQDASKP